MRVGGQVIGQPDDTVASLIQDLRQRYGARLDIDDLMTRYQERVETIQVDARSSLDANSGSFLANPRQGNANPIGGVGADVKNDLTCEVTK
jgi:hypothetical protein